MSGPTGERWEFEAIGTTWRIDTERRLPDDVRAEVSAVIDRFDHDWSRFRDDSLVSELARGAGEVAAPPDTELMLDTFVSLSDATHGAVSPLVGDALVHRGYDRQYGFVDRGALPAPTEWETRLAWTKETLLLPEPALIDVGALGKGRLVDLVLATVAPWVPGRIVVDASGDLAVRGGPERIGLEYPYDPRKAIGVWDVIDRALCASATNRRAWGDGLHHVLDARTGEPVRTIVATWAVAPTAMMADAAATALFFEGGEQWAYIHGIDWVRMTSDGRVEWSPNSEAELFL